MAIPLGSGPRMFRHWPAILACLSVLHLVGCGDNGIQGEGVSPKLQNAIDDAQSGEAFMRSSLADAVLSATELKDACRYVREHPDVSSYVLLMAIRKQAPEDYAAIQDSTKAKVLSEALAKLVFLNDFGYLNTQGSYDDDAAQALLALGEAAIPSLRTVLANREPAPLFGSHASTLAFHYEYRRADWAYRYILLILGRQPSFVPDPDARDKLIAELQNELKTPQ